MTLPRQMLVTGTAGLVALLGCVSPVLMTSTSTPLQGRAYQVVGKTSGESCMQSILGVPFATDASLHTALERARDKVKAEALIEVVVDSRYLYTFFYNQSCTVVRATGIRFTSQPAPYLPPEPAVPALPPAPPAPEAEGPAKAEEPAQPAKPEAPAPAAKTKQPKKTRKQLAAERRKAAAEKKRAEAEQKRKEAEQKKAEAEAKRAAEEKERAAALARRRAEEEAKPVPEQYRVFCKYRSGDPVRVETKAQVIEAEFVKCVHFGVRVKKQGEAAGVIPFEQIWTVRKREPPAPPEGPSPEKEKPPAQPARSPAKPATP